VNVPTDKIEQYSTLDITYMIAADTTSVDLVDIQLLKNTESTLRQVEYNQPYTWSIYFNEVGFYDLSVVGLGITRTF